MRAISLWEPWATAIAKGLKRIETRSWAPDCRGRLLIHAAKTKQCADFVIGNYRKYFEPLGILRTTQLSFGKIVAVCDLVRVEASESLRGTISEMETDFGDYGDDRFGWVLENIEALQPFDWKGKQGFFNVPEELVESARQEVPR